jgi:hypothetical protein
VGRHHHPGAADPDALNGAFARRSAARSVARDAEMPVFSASEREKCFPLQRVCAMFQPES